MSRRKNRVGFFDRAIAMFAAFLLFVGLAFFVWNNMQKDDRDVVIAHDAKEIATIAATTISAKELQQQKNKIIKKDEDKKRQEKQRQEAEKKKLEDIQKQKEQEKKELEVLKEKKEKEEKAIALKKEKEENEKKKRVADAKKKRQLEEKKKKAAEKKRKEKAAADRKKKAQEARENALAAELAAEMSTRESTTIFNRYVSFIKNKLQSNFIAPVGVPAGMVAVVNIRLDESGNVLSSRIVKGSGNFAYDQAALAAVGKASPLPMPKEDMSANLRLRDINLEANF